MRQWFYLYLIFAIVLFACEGKFQTQYYENGALKSKAEVHNGTYHGNFQIFFPNGAIRAKGYWTNGVGNGFIERFDEHGFLIERSHWKDKLQDGLAELYHANGKIKFKGRFLRGNAIGEQLTYSAQGTLQERKLYDDMSNLYYLVKFDSSQSKEIELVLPTFELSKRKDSVYCKPMLKLEVQGNASVKIGQLRESEFIELTPKVDLGSENNTKSVFPFNVLDDLYYIFEYTPSSHDSLPSFEFRKKLLTVKQKPKELDISI
jgi:hypothetical protein